LQSKLGDERFERRKDFGQSPPAYLNCQIIEPEVELTVRIHDKKDHWLSSQK